MDTLERTAPLSGLVFVALLIGGFVTIGNYSSSHPRLARIICESAQQRLAR